MILTQILQPTCVKAPLKGTDKDSVIAELVDALAECGLLVDKDAVLEAVLVREQTRSTGIGSGIAIPHGKCAAVNELVMAMGISPEGIEFDSVDSKPVHIVALLASPSDRTGPHIQALATISRMMLDDEFKTNLQNATSPEAAYELISAKEHE